MKNRAGGSVLRYRLKNGDIRWRFRFDGDALDGKRRMIGAQGFKTRGEAMAALHDAVAAYRERKELPIAAPPPPPPKQTVSDWLRLWLRDYAPDNCSPKTLERYGEFAAYILDATEGEPAALAATPLAEVKHTVVEAALRALLRMPSKRKKHLSVKTVREIAGVLSVAFNEAFRLDKVPVNPLLKVRLPKAEKKESRSLTLAEVERLRNVCRGDWSFVFVEIALATGCRRGELLALTWPDIDYLNSTITVSKSIEQTRAGLRTKAPKNGKVRRFKIGKTAIEALRFLQEEQEQHRLLSGSDYTDLGLVFCLPHGSHHMPHLVSKTMVRRLRRARVPNASLHSLRHTHASGLLSAGMPLPAVSARLGHADTAITARIYSHALPSDDARCADAWERFTEPKETAAPADSGKPAGPVQ